MKPEIFSNRQNPHHQQSTRERVAEHGQRERRLDERRYTQVQRKDRARNSEIELVARLQFHPAGSDTIAAETLDSRSAAATAGTKIVKYAPPSRRLPQVMSPSCWRMMP